MGLTARQNLLYTETFDCYRLNTALDANGKSTYSKVLTGIPCKLYTTPNIDSAFGKMGQSKTDNLFTDNKLHFLAGVDVRAEDFVFMYSPNVSGMPWFRVAGETECRVGLYGVCNRSSVYLMPDVGLTPDSIV